MPGLVNAMVIVAVVVLVVVRQFPDRIDTDKRWWLVPVILAVVAIRRAAHGGRPSPDGVGGPARC
ncbi:hypothetical protein SALBM311S_02541 [Streptomyces alboniger]